MFRLDGKIALVTGSGGGLGLGILRAFARQGAGVIVNDMDPRLAEETAAKLAAEGLAVWAAPFDVTDGEAVRAGVARAEAEIGPIDILVNNAGNMGGRTYIPTPFAQTLPEFWQPFIAVNLMGVLYCTHAVITGMSERKFGRVITVSSTAGRVGKSINVSVYGAAKAGAAHFMRHLSQEVAKDGVTANVISLGFMNTMSGPFADKILPSVPAGRFEASWVTGATLVLDGGYTPF